MHSKNLAEHHKISLCKNLTELCISERYMQPQLCFKLSDLPLGFLNVLSCKLFANIIINGSIFHYSRGPSTTVTLNKEALPHPSMSYVYDFIQLEKVSSLLPFRTLVSFHYAIFGFLW